MNKRFYRIVFNKARGMLIVVAETTRSHRAGVSPQSGAAGLWVSARVFLSHPG
ncbi:ESPR domain-containing protein [Klebsiella oxytoca]